jgi:predicted ATPase
MPKLLGFKIQNYRGLKDISVGQVGFNEGTPLPPLAVFIGRNGSGKSTLLDAFGFLSDCLREGVQSACDKPNRGGFQNLRTRGFRGPISFSIYFRQSETERPITYEVSINEDRNGVPGVVKEVLRQRRAGQKYGQPFPFLYVEEGVGKVWSGKTELSSDEVPTIPKKNEKSDRRIIELSNVNQLAIGSLGQLKEHPRISKFREFMSDWYLSYFVPDAARTLSPSGAQKYIDRSGSNVANVLQFLFRNHKKELEKLSSVLSKQIPGVEKIGFEETQDRRILVRFNEAGFQDPTYQMNMSDGTLKLFAYLLMLYSPERHSLIGIEEPENGLYHKAQEELGRIMTQTAYDTANMSQTIITTHSPYFVGSLQPESVWILKKGTKGLVQAQKCTEIRGVEQLIAQGLPLGNLWYSNHLDEE